MSLMDPRALRRAALVTLLLVRGNGGAAEFGFTEANPSRDEPPALTRSSKVVPSHDPSQSPALGPNPAKVLIVEFCDFTNPDCAKMADAMRQIPEEWPGDVRLEYRQLPAPTSPAVLAASASLAAHMQGKFWPMHDCLYSYKGTLDDAALGDCAEEAGLETK